MENASRVELGYFKWEKARGGYEIRQAVNIGGDSDYHDWFNFGDENDQNTAPFIIQKEKVDTMATIEPLTESPALFAEFAGLDYNDAAAIIAFANHHGPLLPPNWRSYVGEKLAIWQNEIAIMKEAFELWQWAINGDTEKLARVITIKKHETPLKLTNSATLVGTEISRISGNGGKHYLNCDDSFLRRLTPGDLVLPAKALVQAAINDYLSRLPFNWIFEPPVMAQLLFNDHSELEQCLIPTALLAAMWLQFAQHVSGEKKIRRCEICNQWADVTDCRENWTSHELCVNRDKVRKHRKIKQINELLAEGKSIEQVAQVVGEDTRTIKRWLVPKKRGRRSTDK